MNLMRRCGSFALLSIIASACYSFEYDGGPPVVTITVPAPGAQVQNEVQFVAVAVDRDGNVLSDEITWVLNGQPFKVGADVKHTMALGPQTVLARVSDTSGRAGEASVSFEVIE